MGRASRTFWGRRMRCSRERLREDLIQKKKKKKKEFMHEFQISQLRTWKNVVDMKKNR